MNVTLCWSAIKWRREHFFCSVVKINSVGKLFAGFYKYHYRIHTFAQFDETGSNGSAEISH